MAAPASGFRRFLHRLTDREPVVVFAGAIGLLGISMPLFVPSIRASMGFDTTQYHGRPQRESLFGGESSREQAQSGSEGATVRTERWLRAFGRRVIPVFWVACDLLWCKFQDVLT